MPKATLTSLPPAIRVRTVALLGTLIFAFVTVAAPFQAVAFAQPVNGENPRAVSSTSLDTAESPSSETAVAALDHEEPEAIPRPIDVQARISDDGLVHVEETFVWEELVHQRSFVRALPLFMPRSEGTWRRFEYFQFAVTSSDTRLNLVVKDDASQLLATISREPEAVPDPSSSPVSTDETTEPIHVTFSYVVRGATTVRSPSNPETAEFFWSPLASGGSERTDLNFSVIAEQPALSIECSVLMDDSSMLGWADVLDAKESLEENADAPLGSCEQNATSGSVSATGLGRLSTVIVRAHYPKYTFTYDSAIQVEEPPAKEPSESTEPAPQDTFDPTWAENIDLTMDQGNGVLTQVIAGSSLAAVIATVWLLRRKKPDLTYPNLAPGDIDGAEEMQAHSRAMYPRSQFAGTKKVSKKLHAASPTAALQSLPRNQFGSLYSLELNFQQVLVTLIDLADRGHLTITRGSDDVSLQGGSPKLWTLNQLGGADPLSASEASLMHDLFATGNRIKVQSLHSTFAPDLLEVLTLIGEESKSEQLTTQPVKLAATKTGKKIQRTPLGRAYAEQLAGLRAEFEGATTPDSAVRFKSLLSAAFALGAEGDWSRHMATASFEVPGWYQQFELEDISPSEFVDQLRSLLA